MENLRRRTEREVADARTYGIANFARDILAVADNMDRALQALDAEIREKAETGVKALLDGVELTERELIKVMEKHGIARLEPQGQKFDPNLHQAMFEVPDSSVAAGTVVQVVQPGYTIAGRVLAPGAGRHRQGRAESAGGRRGARERQLRTITSATRYCRGSGAGAGRRCSTRCAARSRRSANGRSGRSAATAR